MRSIPFLSIGLVLMAGLGACRQTPPRPGPAAADSASAVAVSPRDELLLAAAKIALPPPGIAAGDLPSPQSPGAVAVAKYCGQCHDLPAPSMHSAVDWPRVTRRMWLRMDRLPPAFKVAVPDEGDRAVLLNYLTANALQVSGSSLPPGRGREEFALICSRCHALPDPTVHSAKDWATVFLRMERNMEKMNVRPPTRAETEAILTYLQEVPAKRQ